MLGTESVLAHLRDLAHGRTEGEPARMSLVDNTVEAVAAEFARRPFEGPWLQVVVRNRKLHPVSGKVLKRPPTALLKQGDRTLALLVGEFLIVSRTAPRCVRVPLVREARGRLMDYELLSDRQIAKLAEDV
jgi:hypothetical protein